MKNTKKGKKAVVNSQEMKLKLAERKAKTRHLIETGGLVVKAGLDHLPNNALYGALLSIKEELDANELVMAAWVVKLCQEVHMVSIAVCACFNRDGGRPSEAADHTEASNCLMLLRFKRRGGERFRKRHDQHVK